MEYFIHLVTGICSNGLFLVFLIAVLGYLLGAINICGIKLGTSAVFLAALVFGHFGFSDTSLLHSIGLITASSASLQSTFSLIQNFGLLCFVTAVGLIAGPNFFRDFKRNIKSYVLIAGIVVGLGVIVSILLIKCGGIDFALATGLLSGALTTTPGYAAAQDAVAGSDLLLKEVSAGYAVAYPFGVIGVVLFVQIVPRLLHADMDKERSYLLVDSHAKTTEGNQAFRVDPMGIFVFSLTVIFGIFLGKISIPLPGGAAFSLGNTGGALTMGLICGHFRKLGKLDLTVPTNVLETLRELGLMMFLIGAGVPSGSGFYQVLQTRGPILFLYGALLTAIPMVCGFLFARYILKMPLLNNLGAITGGMTSTPALGTLIRVADTSNVASSYASVYPVALVLIVLAIQLLDILF